MKATVNDSGSISRLSRSRFLTPAPGRRFLALSASLVLGLLTCLGQPKSGLRPTPNLNPAEAEQRGRALVADLLEQRPQENSTNTGVMTITDSEGSHREVPVQFEVISRPADWLNTYDAKTAAGVPIEKLSILHAGAQPNVYSLSRNPPSGTAKSEPLKLSPEQTMVPFAGSDFWIADLGLEFLHWPKQLLFKQEMRRGRSCNVLTSVNPHPTPGAYSRVVSWLDVESGGIVMAQAWDVRDKLLKEFAPKEMKKIQGQWQLEEMEIRNVQTDSRTVVQFNLGR